MNTKFFEFRVSQIVQLYCSGNILSISIFEHTCFVIGLLVFVFAGGLTIIGILERVSLSGTSCNRCDSKQEQGADELKSG